MVMKVIAGDSYIWRIPVESIRGYCNIPAGALVSAFFQPSSGDSATDLRATKEGNTVEIEINPEDSALLRGSSGTVYLRFKSDGYCKTQSVAEVSVVALDDAGFDLKSEARRNYEAAKRALSTYMQSGGTVRSYTIGTRSTTYNSVQELIDLVEYWKKQVFLEEYGGADSDRRMALVRFV